MTFPIEDDDRVDEGLHVAHLWVEMTKGALAHRTGHDLPELTLEDVEAVGRLIHDEEAATAGQAEGEQVSLLAERHLGEALGEVQGELSGIVGKALVVEGS